MRSRHIPRPAATSAPTAVVGQSVLQPTLVPLAALPTNGCARAAAVIGFAANAALTNAEETAVARPASARTRTRFMAWAARARPRQQRRWRGSPRRNFFTPGRCGRRRFTARRPRPSGGRLSEHRNLNRIRGFPCRFRPTRQPLRSLADRNDQPLHRR